ncbi:Eco57I restriction-modification methylase domain-containing protein [Truepera radiovictrix]|uniref:Eco57I restriction-modification methylase domain-containing protein n=1 Tax=Truepera radiovictrix TaxID=332249 RepID=UPI0002F4780A|nr:Eco57I restriction-modification methylase domain-containing protein [Truepera radiovictrix]WMT57302.1 Eco57I restriction-modification methylase domain-containing protein [Truepera radiovictrix]
MTSHPAPLFDLPEVRSPDLLEAIALLSEAGIEERGAVFTNPEVVHFMLDLVGYTAEHDLTQLRILEPSFGDGSFLLPVVDRLLASWKRHHQSREPYSVLKNSLRAVELHRDTARATEQKVIAKLEAAGIKAATAQDLTRDWLLQDDFLAASIEGKFTHIVGNPPYVRQELISAPLMKFYRSKYATVYDRADLYVPFIERGLRLLEPGGKLSFICSDRWMKNRYGRRLRKLVADNYHLKHYVDMVGTDAFRTEVAAYTSITTIVNDRGDTTAIAKRPKLDAAYLKELAVQLNNEDRAEGAPVEVISNAVNGDEPWLLDCAPQLQLIRAIERAYKPLEEAGGRVGIGVASGCDRVYIAPYDALDVEPERKLPIAMAQDLASGQFVWGGKGIINPFEADGQLANPDHYPKFAAFLEANRKTIAERHVARKNPSGWFRTIDRIYPHLAGEKKLLIPDIRNEPIVAYEEGTAYPHHNLYWVTSRTWDLRALQAVLRSDIAKLFVWAYSVKMRGGWLRFQAQNLRRICLPVWETVSEQMRETLIELGGGNDHAAINAAVFELYNLDWRDIEIIKSIN